MWLFSILHMGVPVNSLWWFIWLFVRMCACACACVRACVCVCVCVCVGVCVFQEVVCTWCVRGRSVPVSGAGSALCPGTETAWPTIGLDETLGHAHSQQSLRREDTPPTMIRHAFSWERTYLQQGQDTPQIVIRHASNTDRTRLKHWQDTPPTVTGHTSNTDSTHLHGPGFQGPVPGS